MQLKAVPDRKPHPFVRVIQWAQLTAAVLAIIFALLLARNVTKVTYPVSNPVRLATVEPPTE